MDKDHNNMVTVDEYIKIFLQAEEVLNNKLQKIDNSLRELEIEKERISYEYDQVQQVEKLNEFGIMFGSVLDVTIINAEHLKIEYNDQINVMTYCLLSCSSRKFQTKFANSYNPVWNESFTL